MLELWLATFIIEGILLLWPPLWRLRKPAAIFLIGYVIVSTLWLVSQLDFIGGVTLVFLALFRLSNMLRLVKGRMHSEYLRRAFGRTSLRLFMLHPLLLSLSILPILLSSIQILSLLMVIQLTAAAVALIVTGRNIFKLRFQMPRTYLTDHELPTVTVAIPARNETIDLEQCLQSLVANDYPKMEILVLDDCSQDKTAEVIRGFAQDGVRFVEGDEPAERWLAKNQAYQKLYQAASGELILFCGVDARFGPQAIRGMVNLLRARRKSMLSVLPLRLHSSPSAIFIQPLRYWWELALPRRLFNKPPVLSTCWMINRRSLKKLGGFAAVSHSILPEGFFARELVKSDGYSFVRSSNELAVYTTKNLQAEYDTAIRTRYPLIRRRLEWVLIMTLINIIFLLTPFILLFGSIWWQGINIWLALASCLFLVVTHVMVVNVTDPANSLLAAITFPLVVVVELGVSYISIIKYEFLGMEWKDRDICIPVMHVIPKLPKA